MSHLIPKLLRLHSDNTWNVKMQAVEQKAQLQSNSLEAFHSWYSFSTVCDAQHSLSGKCQTDEDLGCLFFLPSPSLPFHCVEKGLCELQSFSSLVCGSRCASAVLRCLSAPLPMWSLPQTAHSKRGVGAFSNTLLIFAQALTLLCVYLAHISFLVI